MLGLGGTGLEFAEFNSLFVVEDAVQPFFCIVNRCFPGQHRGVSFCWVGFKSWCFFQPGISKGGGREKRKVTWSEYTIEDARTSFAFGAPSFSVCSFSVAFVSKAVPSMFIFLI